jgi:hypothetical protein
VDGGAGDQDSVENGIIVDPGGLGLIELASSAPVAPSAPDVFSPTSGGGDGGGGGGGCFVSTVAWNLDMASRPTLRGVLRCSYSLFYLFSTLLIQYISGYFKGDNSLKNN